MAKMPPDQPEQPHEHALTASDSPGTILVVDDEPGNLRLLTSMLDRAAYQVRTVINGEMALRSVALEAPDLILLDITMPGLNGYEVCARLKADPTTRAIPVIFISALSDVNDKIKAFTTGGVDYITKPFQLEEVMARVSTHLTLRHTQQQLHQSVEMLEHRNREMGLLNTLSDLLQRAQTTNEAYNDSAPLLEQLFPQQQGALYVTHPETQQCEIAFSWGHATESPPPTIAEACPVLQEHHPGAPDHTRLDCPYLQDNTAQPVVCVSLASNDQNLGLLHMRGNADNPRRYGERLRLATMVADRFALTLANLRLRDRLREESIRDPLTGLLNRRYLDDLLEREVNRALRYERPVGLIIIDIDHFKRFNDTYGHPAGDTLLRSVGTYLNRHTRNGDVACRYGGEEFVLVLPESTPEATYQRASELQAGIRQIKATHGGVALTTITVSLGVASVPHHGTSAASVIQAADGALYVAKANGRDQVIMAEIGSATV